MLNSSTCLRRVIRFRDNNGGLNLVRPSRLALHQNPKTICQQRSLKRSIGSTTSSEPLTKSIHGVKAPSLSILPLASVMRSLSVTAVTSFPFLLHPTLRLLSFLANSKMAFCDPERNPLLRQFLRTTIYAQFCAGETPPAVQNTVKGLKNLGFSGVILGYAREVVMDEDEIKAAGGEAALSPENEVHEVAAWKDGTLKTVDIAEENDFVALKLSGAGRKALNHLLRGLQPSTELNKALEDICDRAKARNVRLLIDAEQQAVQHTIDVWILHFQRQYNRDFAPEGIPRALVYGTYQAYLLSTPSLLAQHMAVAQREGFVLGAKLVRGAYLASDPQRLFHKTKKDTDEAYNNIAGSLITQKYGSVLEEDRISLLQSKAENTVGLASGFPTVDLVLATHNRESVAKVRALRDEQSRRGEPMIEMAYGQLQGMADDISCQLVQESKDRNRTDGIISGECPKVYKYVVWGTVGECTKYLLRRGQENRDAASRTKDTRIAMLKELKRRFLGVLPSAKSHRKSFN
jgi:proline dehydrogenase